MCRRDRELSESLAKLATSHVNKIYSCCRAVMTPARRDWCDCLNIMLAVCVAHRVLVVFCIQQRRKPVGPHCPSRTAAGRWKANLSRRLSMHGDRTELTQRTRHAYTYDLKDVEHSNSYGDERHISNGDIASHSPSAWLSVAEW